MPKLNFIAFDLGATSGRTILGTLDTETEKLETRELTRFPNAIFGYGGKSYWNLFSLYNSIKEGLKCAASENVNPVSAGIDTWGVDFVCFDEDATPIGNPRAYRDTALTGAPERFFKNSMPSSELYRRTGIQHLDFNTVFQLAEYAESFPVRTAAKILFMPDALSLMLTGKAVTEYTIASTGAVVNAYTRELDPEIMEKTGVMIDKFAPVVEPATSIGTITPDIAVETGIGEIPVIAVAGHDTASAVVAIPSPDTNFAYLSSGTWSLMGIETKNPVINEITERENITNEGGVDGTFRVLKNITGMWIIEQCLQSWKRKGINYSYPEVVALAAAAPAFKSFINPDDPCFTAPADMPAAIEDYCRRTSQTVPENQGEFLRIVFESLALKYRHILNIFRSVAENPIDRLHVIGGGSRNELLNQFTADAIGIPVFAGPAEASALGNIMVQAQAAGAVSDLAAIRRIMAKNITLRVYNPAGTAVWDEAYSRFRHLM